MPIKGLTDVTALGLPIIGTLRKGGPREERTNKKGEKIMVVGRDLDHFRFVTDDPKIAAAFVEVYGGQPKEVNVLLPFPTPEANFETWREEWVAGGLRHRCNGEFTVLLRRGQEFDQNPHPCPGGCKPIGRLNVVIPELKRLALVTVLTSSQHDLRELWRNLNSPYESRGSLIGIPFLLKRRLREISTPVDKSEDKRARRGNWLMSLEAHPLWAERLFIEARKQAMELPMAQGWAPKLLTAPLDEDDEPDVDEAGLEQEERRLAFHLQAPAQPASVPIETHRPIPPAPDWLTEPDEEEDAIEGEFEPAPAGPSQRPHRCSDLNWNRLLATWNTLVNAHKVPAEKLVTRMTNLTGQTEREFLTDDQAVALTRDLNVALSEIKAKRQKQMAAN